MCLIKEAMEWEKRVITTRLRSPRVYLTRFDIPEVGWWRMIRDGSRDHACIRFTHMSFPLLEELAGIAEPIYDDLLNQKRASAGLAPMRKGMGRPRLLDCVDLLALALHSTMLLSSKKTEILCGAFGLSTSAAREYAPLAEKLLHMVLRRCPASSLVYCKRAHAERYINAILQQHYPTWDMLPWKKEDLCIGYFLDGFRTPALSSNNPVEDKLLRGKVGTSFNTLFMYNVGTMTLCDGVYGAYGCVPDVNLCHSIAKKVQSREDGLALVWDNGFPGYNKPFVSGEHVRFARPKQTEAITLRGLDHAKMCSAIFTTLRQIDEGAHAGMRKRLPCVNDPTHFRDAPVLRFRLRTCAMLWNFLTRRAGWNQGQTQYRRWVDAVFRRGLELAADDIEDRPARGEVGATRVQNYMAWQEATWRVQCRMENAPPEVSNYMMGEAEEDMEAVVAEFDALVAQGNERVQVAKEAAEARKRESSLGTEALARERAAPVGGGTEEASNSASQSRRRKKRRRRDIDDSDDSD